MRPERVRTIALLALAVLPPVLEASVVAAIGFQAARALAPQASAIWPYHSYHDMRWLLVYHNSIPGFVVELLVVTLLRGLLSAGLVALSWPKEVPRPSLRWLARRNVEIAALTGVVVSPWAALCVAFSVVALSWVLLASLLPMLILSPFLVRAGAVANWWRGLPSLELVGWSALNLALLTVAGAAAASTPGWWAVPVVAVAGIGNGLLRRQTVREAVLPRHMHWPRVPVAPLAIALTVILSVVAQSVIGFAAGAPQEWRPPILTQPLPPDVRHAVIVLAGHDSFYDGRPAVDPGVELFSYWGLDAQGRPLPYPPEATHRSLESSTALLAAQVDVVHRRTRRPVALIGQSEGALVIRTYLEQRRPGSPVDVALEFSPLIRPGRAYYPPSDQRSGWGVVTGWELRGVFALANIGRAEPENPDEPFIRSILENAPFYRNRTLCPVPDVRIIGFLPTTTAIEAPPGRYTEVPVFQLPAFHGGLIGRRSVQNQLVNVLEGRLPAGQRREYSLFQRLGAAWQAPPLAVSINPAWRDVREPDPSFSGRICQSG